MHEFNSDSDDSESQMNLMEFEEADSSKIKNIYANQIRRLLAAVKKQRRHRESAVIIFHNDSDGLCAALYIKQVLKDLKFIIEPEDFKPITHIEKDKLEIDDEKLYFFLDIQPKDANENIFCIDHHNIDNRKRYISKNMLIYSPDDIEYEFLTTATFLSMYLRYVHHGYRFSFTRFIDDRAWWKNEFDRFVSIFAAVADNLWLLSKYSPTQILKNWIREVDIKERKFIKVSMGISLLLGREDYRLKGFDGLFNIPINMIEISRFDELVEQKSQEIDNLYRFARAIDREARHFVVEQNDIVDDAISNTSFELDRDKKTMADYLKSMPIDMRKDIETAVEMLKTVGDKDKAKWKQVEFYGKEVDRLQTHMKSLEHKLKLLEEKKAMIHPDNIPGICVFISKQSSEQVKGILSSLLYYFGQKNIVIEETEHYAVWGARGFTREELEEELMTLIFDKNMLESYRRMENIARDLPTSYRKSLNISHNITLARKYVGGMGGRGLVYGGNIHGKVPQLFAILDISDLEEKIQELISHGELGKAIKGLTEGESEVNTVNALRTKFKSMGWVTVQVIGGSGSGDILSAETGMPIAWLAGSNKNINLTDKFFGNEKSFNTINKNV